MKKIKLIASNVANSTEKMRLELNITKNQHIDLENEILGSGSVMWDQWYDFTILELDNNNALMDWKDDSFFECKSTIDILNRRLVVGEKIRYIDEGEHYIYQIEEIRDEIF
ncbi:hypothetical protein [Klebsiella michiganensis]|uniref:hypothetical protein n=1 Tax=Klebsiella michiganensis TaxID=1134687 RepID=UPI000A2DC4E6|nr:hypothetical protein [Klebsiella michiganensis]OSY95232.1 hypothetical protein BM280_06735 [Klebsiella michiganensis]